jgi:hypothetical protein
MNHSFGVDFFALGVIAFEFMIGKVVYFLIRDRILALIGRKLDKRF